MIQLVAGRTGPNAAGIMPKVHYMKQVLGIKDEAARMKVTPPLAVAPLAHGDDMRWNPNDDGINFNP